VLSPVPVSTGVDNSPSVGVGVSVGVAVGVAVGVEVGVATDEVHMHSSEGRGHIYMRRRETATPKLAIDISNCHRSMSMVERQNGEWRMWDERKGITYSSTTEL
jgi:hypothetical protein